jgi:hypothetical protein
MTITGYAPTQSITITIWTPCPACKIPGTHSAPVAEPEDLPS